MSTSGNSPLFGWWVFARRAIDALSTPRADIARCDRTVERLARASWLGSIVDGVSTTIRRAWRTSWSHDAASWLASRLTPAPQAAAIRAAGWMIVVAGATTLVLDAIKPRPVGPLSWAVPAALVAAGVLLMVAAAPLARATADRRLRHHRP